MFGDGHPAIDFLLLLAVADDLCGIIIIAVFYPDPSKIMYQTFALLEFRGFQMCTCLNHTFARLIR